MSLETLTSLVFLFSFWKTKCCSNIVCLICLDLSSWTWTVLLNRTSSPVIEIAPFQFRRTKKSQDRPEVFFSNNWFEKSIRFSFLWQNKFEANWCWTWLVQKMSERRELHVLSRTATGIRDFNVPRAGNCCFTCTLLMRHARWGGLPKAGYELKVVSHRLHQVLLQNKTVITSEFLHLLCWKHFGVANAAFLKRGTRT